MRVRTLWIGALGLVLAASITACGSKQDDLDEGPAGAPAAGGDHLHFTMLVAGRMVNPVEWWDPHWIQDRVMRKLAEAGQAAGASR